MKSENTTCVAASRFPFVPNRDQFAMKHKLAPFHAFALGGSLCLGFLGACDEKPASSLRGQTNVAVVYYGKAVDQDGAALSNVEFQFQVDAYPKDWTFESRGRAYEINFVTVLTNQDGWFEIKADGCLIRHKRIAPPSGYTMLFKDEVEAKTGLRESVRLVSWGEQQYQSDPANPAVYVFVKDGENEVSALPSRGGFDAYGKEWRPNKPAWPKKPWLKDVVYKPPTTQPATTQSIDSN